MHAHRHTSVITIELKPGQGALPFPPPRVAGALLVGWLLLAATGSAIAANENNAGHGEVSIVAIRP